MRLAAASLEIPEVRFQPTPAGSDQENLCGRPVPSQECFWVSSLAKRRGIILFFALGHCQGLDLFLVCFDQGLCLCCSVHSKPFHLSLYYYVKNPFHSSGPNSCSLARP